jgi:hypothetical protein
LNDAISTLVVVALLFAIGYGLYSKLLKQMAINVKNKRIYGTKSHTGQAGNTAEAGGIEYRAPRGPRSPQVQIGFSE